MRIPVAILLLVSTAALAQQPRPSERQPGSGIDLRQAAAPGLRLPQPDTTPEKRVADRPGHASSGASLPVKGTDLGFEAEREEDAARKRR